jgi:hypothetical protein
MRQRIIKTLLLMALTTGSLQADEEYSCAGDCYASCRNSCLLAAGIGIGVLLFVGMVAVVVNDSTNSHSHN